MGCESFGEKLGQLFCNHLSSVKEIDVSACDVPMTIYEIPETPSLSNGLRMPMLESLFLDSLVVDAGLEALFASHAQTLKSIHLRNCYAKPAWDSFEGFVPWARLFNSLVTEEPKKLHTFMLTTRDETKLFSDIHSSQQHKR
jgi:hypothetical protein